MNRLPVIILIISSIFYGCNQGHIMPTTGTVTVEVDPAVLPIITSEATAFDSLYKTAKIEIKTATPVEGMVNLLNKKSKMFVCTRYFSKQQSNFFESQKLDVNILKFVITRLQLFALKIMLRIK